MLIYPQIENLHIYAGIDSKFYRRLVDLLCIQHAIEKQFMVSLCIDNKTAREVQGLVLAILHNMAAYKDAPSKRACQQSNCVDVLMTLVDSPNKRELSTKAATILSDFCEVEENVPFMRESLEKMVLLVIRDASCCGPLLQILSKSSYDEQ